MQFIDEAEVHCTAGHGGPGCVSFRREKYVARGGPNGGDGGRGGSVRFVATKRLNSLQPFRYRRIFKAQNGQPGMGSLKTGRDGESIVVSVPVGTIIRDSETREILIDLAQDDQEWIACKGGRGGRGNTHFKTATFQAPKFAQTGEAGGEGKYRLELKLLADIGIIGQPNAGKSTFLSTVSAARPKIADYPFTTLIPQLGVIEFEEHRTFVAADIPGLIKGAHRGSGLGHQFLKHIERTRVLLHLLDGERILEVYSKYMNPSGLRKAVEKAATLYREVRSELTHFNSQLGSYPEIVAVNKSDILPWELKHEMKTRFRDRLEEFKSSEPVPGEPILISAATGDGISELKKKLSRLLEDESATQLKVQTPEREFQPAPNEQKWENAGPIN